MIIAVLGSCLGESGSVEGVTQSSTVTRQCQVPNRQEGRKADDLVLRLKIPRLVDVITPSK